MIVVFGSIGVDLVTRLPRFPRPGETIACDGYVMIPGTKGANQALAAARAGARVALIATLGQDSSAEVAASLLRAEGVDLGHVRSVPGPTGTCLITVVESGENTVVAASGANLATTIEPLADLSFGKDDTLILQLEIDRGVTFEAIRLGRERGARVILNAAPAGPVPHEILALLDLLVVNETEAEAVGSALGLDERDPEAIGQRLNEECGCAVLVTLGAGGATAFAGGGERVHVAAPAVRVVDTTAAGDSFIGFLAASLEAGFGLADSMRRGVAGGSLCCMRSGAQTGIPVLAEVEAFLASGTA